MDCSPPGSSVHEILQARILEWVAIPFSRGSSWPRDQIWVSCIAGRFFTIWATRSEVKSLSRVRLFATPWTVAYQAPPSMGFSRQEYWSGVPLPSSYSTYCYLLLFKISYFTCFLLCECSFPPWRASSSQTEILPIYMKKVLLEHSYTHIHWHTFYGRSVVLQWSWVAET